MVAEFKELVEKQKTKDEQEAVVERQIMRKPKNPIANRKNYQEENERMAVRNEVDLILDDIQKAQANKKFDKELIKFSQDVGAIKKEKEQKFLTIEGLLNHQYFMSINVADISVVLEQFDQLQEPDYDLQD